MSALSLNGLAVPSTKEEAVAVLEALEELIGGGFHPDTRGADYASTTWAGPRGIGAPSSVPTFSPHDAAKLDRIMDRVFELVDDPYAVSFEAFKRLHPEEF